MAALRRWTVAELAEHVDRPADTVYYHVRKLIEAGLVETVDHIATGKRPKAVYALAGGRLRIDRNRRDPDYVGALQDSASAAFRHGERLLSEALTDEDTRYDGPSANLRLQQITVRLGTERRRALWRLFEEIDALLLDEQTEAEERSGEWFTVTLAASRQRGSG